MFTGDNCEKGYEHQQFVFIAFAPLRVEPL